MADATAILSRLEQGDPSAAEELLPLVYDELKRLAARRIAGENPGHTLQATALVHEAYLRLIDQEHPQQWNSQGHFFVAAAEAMRRILIEAARRKRQVSRGGTLDRVPLEGVEIELELDAAELLAIDEALDELQARDAASAELVKLRYFAGLSMAEAASALGMSLRTAERNWTYARTWLRRQLG